MFKLQWTRIQNTQFTVYKHTGNLESNQNNQTCNNSVNPKQDYNHAKVESFALMVPEKKPALLF